MLMSRLLIAILLGCPLSAFAATDQCTTQQDAVASLRARITADLDKIRGIKIGVTADELDQWASAADEERHHILVQGIESGISALAGGVQSTSENTLKPMDVAGYHLPSGIGSLGTGQANAIIGHLRAWGDLRHGLRCGPHLQHSKPKSCKWKKGDAGIP